MGKKPSFRIRRYALSNPPSIEACLDLQLKISHRIEQQIEYATELIASSHELNRLNRQTFEQLVLLLQAIAIRPGRFPHRLAACKAVGSLAMAGREISVGFKDALENIICDTSAFAWLKAEALKALAHMEFKRAFALAQDEFKPGQEYKDAFVTRRAFVPVVFAWGVKGRQLISKVFQEDPSPAVRQKALMCLLKSDLSFPGDLVSVYQREESSIVKSAWVLVFQSSHTEKELLNSLELAFLHLFSETDNAVVQFCLRTLAEKLNSLDQKLATDGVIGSLELLSKTMKDHAKKADLSIEIHSWGWLVVQLASIWTNFETQRFFTSIRKLLANLPEGKRKRIPRDQCPKDPDQIELALSSLAALDFGYFAKFTKKWLIVQRGYRRSNHVWRFLHEIRNPAYDKRQAHSHLNGMEYYGDFWFCPLVMAEVTRTRVPGENIFFPQFNHWVPQVPGPTQAVNLKHRKQVQLILPGAKVWLTESIFVSISSRRPIVVTLFFSVSDLS